ncbi:hypothetical protein GEMRC1_013888 [Eukaryota sp. GEM-RC1]
MGYTYDMLFDANVDIRQLCCNASEDTIVRAVWTYYWLGKTQAQIAEYYCVSQPTISRWIASAFENKKPNEEELDPRLKLSAADLSFIQNTLHLHPLLYLREIASLVHKERGKKVSVSTIQRALVSMGYTHKRCRALVRRAKLELILSFENRINHRGIVLINQLVFIDEVSFRASDFQRSSGWSLKGNEIVVEQVDLAYHNISACVAITQHGFLSAFVQYGHFSRLQFVKFIQNLLFHGYLGTSGFARSCIILDGCKIHVDLNISQALRKAGVEYFVLPPYCPESNPIEVFFKVFKSKVLDFFEHNPRGNELVDLFRVLDTDMRFSCHKIFAHCGWSNETFFKSTYRTNSMLAANLAE